MSATIQNPSKFQAATPTSSRGLLRAVAAIACVMGLALAGFAGAASAKGKNNKGKARGANLQTQAKTDLQVGEQPDGYLGLVDEKAPEKIKKMVRDTNERRKARYEDVARRRGSSLESVLEQAGEGRIERTKPGQYLLDSDGKWVKKK